MARSGVGAASAAGVGKGGHGRGKGPLVAAEAAGADVFFTLSGRWLLQCPLWSDPRPKVVNVRSGPREGSAAFYVPPPKEGSTSGRCFTPGRGQDL